MSLGEAIEMSGTLDESIASLKDVSSGADKFKISRSLPLRSIMNRGLARNCGKGGDENGPLMCRLSSIVASWSAQAAADQAGLLLLGTVSSETRDGSIRVSAPNLRSEMTRSASACCVGVIAVDTLSMAA